MTFVLFLAVLAGIIEGLSKISDTRSGKLSSAKESKDPFKYFIMGD